MSRTPLNAWSQMIEHLEQRGFQPYPINENQISTGSTDSIHKNAALSTPLTIIQLVRSSMGVPMHMADYPTFAFWEGVRLQKSLDAIWSALDTAVREMHPGTHSIVAWCFRLPPPSGPEVIEIVNLAKAKAPEIFVANITPRPLSLGLVQPKSLQTVAINMIGVIRTTLQLGYGELLTQIAGGNEEDAQLLIYLDSFIPTANRRTAQADRSTPIPALLARAFFIGADQARIGFKTESICQFLLQLNETNTLASLTDQGLTRSLITTDSKSVNGTNGHFPVQLNKLISQQLATTD